MPDAASHGGLAGTLRDRAARRRVMIVAAWAAVGLAYLAARTSGPRDRLAATYWTNAEWSGAAALSRTEGAIHADREDLARLLGDAPAYSAVWRGVAYVPRDGEYDITVTSDDGSWVVVDGATVIDNGGRHGARTKSARLRLARGDHPITIRYFDAGGLAVIAFSWRADGALGRLLPPGVLYPAPPPPGRGGTDWALAVAVVPLGGLLVALTVAVVAVAVGRARALRDPGGALATAVFALLIAAYAVQLVAKRSLAVTACDTYAYLQGAVAMAGRGPLHSELEDPLVPRIVSGFRERPGDRDLAFFLSPHGHYVYDFARGVSHNVFPPGLMWLLLPAVATGGPSWALLLLPAMTPAVALALFLLARRSEGAWFAACAASFLVWNGVVFENSVLLMSDVPSMALTAATVYLLFLNLGRPRVGFPVAAGACFGLALTIRYSNAAAIVPALALFALEWGRRRDLKSLARDVALFGATGAAAGLLPLALYTQAQFGTPFRLTYDPYTASRMTLGHFLPNLAFYASGLVRTFGVPGLAVAAVGLVACAAKRGRRVVAALGALTLAAFLLPYAFEGLREHRYLMPVYPWLALFYGFGAVAIGDLLRRSRAARLLALATLAVAPLAVAWRHLPGGTPERQRSCAALAARVGRDAVVFCDDFSGPVRLYAGLPGYRFIWTRFEVLSEACDILGRMGRPVYFLLDDESAQNHFELLRKKGVLRPDGLALVGDVDGRPLWRYAGGG